MQQRTNSPVNVGEVLAGKYRVERVLGAGGMGVVVAAVHLQLDTRVALKFMFAESLVDREAVSRFVREARAAARLRGEHVARVTDVGTLDNGAPYLVMEYLEGEDLGQLVQRHGQQDIGAAAEYIRQACEAIEEAHAQGIVHRDLKPSNLFLTRRPNGQPCIKVLDFGISKLANATSASAMQMTNTSAVFGSPMYMAPEQMRSARAVDHRADIWSLGATLYELVTGRVPFEGESLMELCLKLAQEDPPAPSSLRPGLPAGLESVLLRCLEKEPSRRFPSVTSLAKALGPFAKRESIAPVDGVESTELAAREPSSSLEHSPGAVTGSDSSDAPAGPGTSSASIGSRTGTTWGRTGRLQASRPKIGGIIVAAGVGLVTLVALGTWLLAGPTSQELPAAAAGSAVAKPVGQPARSAAPANAPAVAPSPTVSKPLPVVSPAPASEKPLAAPSSTPAASAAPSAAAPRSRTAKATNTPRVQKPAPAAPRPGTTTDTSTKRGASDPFANPD